MVSLPPDVEPADVVGVELGVCSAEAADEPLVAVLLGVEVLALDVPVDDVLVDDVPAGDVVLVPLGLLLLAASVLDVLGIAAISAKLPATLAAATTAVTAEVRVVPLRTPAASVTALRAISTPLLLGSGSDHPPSSTVGGHCERPVSQA